MIVEIAQQYSNPEHQFIKRPVSLITGETGLFNYILYAGCI